MLTLAEDDIKYDNVTAQANLDKMDEEMAEIKLFGPTSPSGSVIKSVPVVFANSFLRGIKLLRNSNVRIWANDMVTCLPMSFLGSMVFICGAL
jgi:hypothetical protein